MKTIPARKNAYIARVRASLKDVKAGRVRRVTAQKLINKLGLEG